jgi:hypothetical protein
MSELSVNDLHLDYGTGARQSHSQGRFHGTAAR